MALVYKVYVFFLCMIVSLSSENNTTYLHTVHMLFNRIQDMQEPKDIEARPPLIWARKQGLYGSDMKFNFHGSPEMTALRHKVGIYHSDRYATFMIISSLLEAFRFGKAPKPSEEQLLKSVQALSINSSEEMANSDIYTANAKLFSNNDSDVTTVVRRSVNLARVLQERFVNFFSLMNSSFLVDLGSLFRDLDSRHLHDTANVIKQVLSQRNVYKEMLLNAPPVIDDLCISLGLRSVLEWTKADFKDASSKWSFYSYNISLVINEVKRHTYQPFSSDKRKNGIDPRTYFYMREFLKNAKKNQRNVSLVTTRVLDRNISRINPATHIVGQVSYVDVTISAAVLHGLTNSILTGLVSLDILDDPEIVRLYRNTSSMLAFQIKTNFSGRLDLAMPHHPSEFQLYWFVARTCAELRSRFRRHGLPDPTLVGTMLELNQILRGHCTVKIIQSAVSDGNEGVYFDSFLGNGDIDWQGKAMKFAEDRLYTTAMAINTLISTWTVWDEESWYLFWDKDTPSHVKGIIKSAVKWLNRHILGGIYKPWNTFSSMPPPYHTETWNTSFPSNICLYPNGTAGPDSSAVSCHCQFSVCGMQGTVLEDWYLRQLTERGNTDFHGYNNSTFLYPFWSSEAYTYAAAMLAISTYTNTIDYYDVFKDQD